MTNQPMDLYWSTKDVTISQTALNFVAIFSGNIMMRPALDTLDNMGLITQSLTTIGGQDFEPMSVTMFKAVPSVKNTRLTEDLRNPLYEPYRPFSCIISQQCLPPLNV